MGFQVAFESENVFAQSNLSRWRVPDGAATEQELSCRKQIARQLCTQYAQGIYSPKYYTMTLKSRLKVIQGHWKRNHWIDHTRLSGSRVI